MLVSIRRLEFESAWKKIMEDYTADNSFEGKIMDVNRGGAMVAVNGLRGFLPGSHCCGFRPTEDIIGNTYTLKFLEVN